MDFVHRNFSIIFLVRLTKIDGNAYDAKTNAKLIDNLVPFLNSKVKLRKHNKLLDKIEYPGILSTIKATLTYSKSDATTQSCNRFKSYFNNKFEEIGNFTNFGRDFLNVNIHIYIKEVSIYLL